MKKVSRRWFMKAGSIGAVGLATFLPMLKGARVDKNAAPLPDNLPIHPSSKPEPLPEHGYIRRLPLCLGATVVAPRSYAVISASPGVAFKLDRLVTPTERLVISALTVAGVNQFTTASGGMVPTELFSPRAVTVRLSGDLCRPGEVVKLTLFNPTDEPRTFSGAIIGDVEAVA